MKKKEHFSLLRNTCFPFFSLYRTRSKEDQSFRKISNSDEEIPNVNSNNGISGEDDSGVNLGAPLCSSTNSDQDSNQRPCSQNSVVKTCGGK